MCTQVCPQGVHIAEINTQARAKLKERDGFSIRDRIIARPPLLGRAGTPAAPLVNKTLANRPLRLLGEKLIGVHHAAAVPTFAGRTFQGWAKKHQSPPASRRVAYFHGCGANWYEPVVGEKTVGLLEAIGCQVDVPRGQSCCGLPLQSNGQFDAARKYVRTMAKRLAPAARAGVDILGTSTSCTLMLKREAREILDLMEDPDLKVVSEHIYDICEYLVMLHDRGELALELQRVAHDGDVPRALPAAGPRHRQAGAGADGADPGADGDRE